MTDPTAALAEALAEALNAQGRMPCYDPACSDRHLGYCPTEIAEIAAAAAALPPDWCGHEAEIARLREAIDGVLSDEPVLDPTPKGVIWRWYSEGWNRCARDVRAALEADR